MHLIIRKIYLEKIRAHLNIVSKEFNNDRILIKANKNNLVLFLASPGVNSYIRLELPLNAFLDIKVPGEVLISVGTFNNLLDHLDMSKDLEVYRAEKNYLQFFSGSYECDLVLINDEIKDMDISKEIAECKPIVVPYDAFKVPYLRFKRFLSVFEKSSLLKPVLKNIHFKKDKDSSSLEVWVANQYSAMCGEFKMDTDEEFKLNIYPSVVALLIGIYGRSKTINLYLIEDGEYLVFSEGGCTVKTRLLTDNYPISNSWFNVSKTIDFSVSKKELLHVIERNLLLPDKNLKQSLYRLDKDSLLVEYKNSERGKCREFIEVKGNKNHTIDFYLNNLLLKGLVKLIEANDDIVFKVHDSLKPIILQSRTPSNFKQFILPSKNV